MRHLMMCALVTSWSAPAYGQTVQEWKDEVARLEADNARLEAAVEELEAQLKEGNSTKTSAIDLHPDGTWTPIVPPVVTPQGDALPFGGLILGMTPEALSKKIRIKPKGSAVSADHIDTTKVFKELGATWNECHFAFEVTQLYKMSCFTKRQKNRSKPTGVSRIEEALAKTLGSPTTRITIYENQQWMDKALESPKTYRMALWGKKVRRAVFWESGDVRVKLETHVFGKGIVYITHNLEVCDVSRQPQDKYASQRCDDLSTKAYAKFAFEPQVIVSDPPLSTGERTE